MLSITIIIDLCFIPLINENSEEITRGRENLSYMVNIMGFKDFKIGTKLSLGFGIILILMVVVGIIGYNSLQQVKQAAPLIDAAMEMKLSLQKEFWNSH